MSTFVVESNMLTCRYAGMWGAYIGRLGSEKLHCLGRLFPYSCVIIDVLLISHRFLLSLQTSTNICEKLLCLCACKNNTSQLHKNGTLHFIRLNLHVFDILFVLESVHGAYLLNSWQISQICLVSTSLHWWKIFPFNFASLVIWFSVYLPANYWQNQGWWEPLSTLEIKWHVKHFLNQSLVEKRPRCWWNCSQQHLGVALIKLCVNSGKRTLCSIRVQVVRAWGYKTERCSEQ